MHVSSQTFSKDSVPVWITIQHDCAEKLIKNLDHGISKQLSSLRTANYMVTVVIRGDCVIQPDTGLKHHVWHHLLLDVCVM